MVQILQRSLVLLGGLLALLSSLLWFPTSGFFSGGMGVHDPHAVFAYTFALFTGRLGFSPRETFALVLIDLSAWGILLLALLQTGLGVWTWHRSFQRVHAQSVRLALGGVSLIALSFLSNALIVAPAFSFLFNQLLLLKSFPLWLPALGFLLILVTGSLPTRRKPSL